MFPGDPGGDEPVRDRLLFHVIKTQAEAMQHLAAINELLVQKLDPPRDQRNGQPESEPKSRRAHLPQNKELRQWDTFRAYFLRLEAAARRQFQLKPDDEVTKEQVFRAGGPHARTTTRIMVETHGLIADQWPPSTWPKESPEPPSGQILRLS